MTTLFLVSIFFFVPDTSSAFYASTQQKQSIWEISEDPAQTTTTIPLILDLNANGALIFERVNDSDNLSQSFRFFAAAEYEAASWLWFNSLVDTGYLFYEEGGFLSPDEDANSGSRSALDFIKAGDPIRGVSLSAAHRGLTLQIGRIPNSIGNGLIYENYGLGFISRLDGETQFDMPFRAELSAQMVGSKWSSFSLRNTLISLQAEYDFSEYESIFILGAAYRERENNLTNAILAPQFSTRENNNIEICNQAPDSEACYYSSLQLSMPDNEEISSSTGNLRYIGMGGNLFVLNQINLEGIIIGMFGNGTTSLSPPESMNQPGGNPSAEPSPTKPRHTLSASFKALAAQLQATVVLDESYEISWEIFALSGNPTELRPQASTTGKYTSFVGISPYWAWSGIFFESGLDRNAYSNDIQVAGDYGQGVAGLGPTLDYTSDQINLEIRALGLYALNESESSYGLLPTYGVELNSIVNWQLNSYIGLAAEADIFFPGSNYSDSGISYRLLGFINGQLSL